MKIFVSFEADSVERLREQMEAFLGPKPEVVGRLKELRQEGLNGLKEAVKKAKKASPEREPEVEKVPTPEPQSEPDEEVLDAVEEEDEPVTPDAEKAVAAQKLKDQQLSRLRDLFNAGKGSLVRELLAKYGHGAKVFPEVDAKHFPAIKVELDRELGAH